MFPEKGGGGESPPKNLSVWKKSLAQQVNVGIHCLGVAAVVRFGVYVVWGCSGRGFNAGPRHAPSPRARNFHAAPVGGAASARGPRVAATRAAGPVPGGAGREALPGRGGPLPSQDAGGGGPEAGGGPEGSPGFRRSTRRVGGAGRVSGCRGCVGGGGCDTAVGGDFAAFHLLFL